MPAAAVSESRRALQDANLLRRDDFPGRPGGDRPGNHGTLRNRPERHRHDHGHVGGRARLRRRLLRRLLRHNRAPAALERRLHFFRVAADVSVPGGSDRAEGDLRQADRAEEALELLPRRAERHRDVRDLQRLRRADKDFFRERRERSREQPDRSEALQGERRSFYQQGEHVGDKFERHVDLSK